MGQTICMRQPTKKTSIGRPVNEVNCWRVAAIGPLFRHRASPSPPTEITMSAFLAALKAGPLLADGAMGSYIFERTGRLSEVNHVYEALSVDDPDLIRTIHLSYLQAGARCLTTNSASDVTEANKYTAVTASGSPMRASASVSVARLIAMSPPPT